MFGLFKKKSEIEKLEIKYRKLLEESHRLSTTNRSQSDEKMYEANEVLKEIDKLKEAKKES
ncbi:MAG: Lacal_2735 family protein [Christiangramia sp.]|nr:Lacal_2735 family protein [Christiangramia sp.]